MKIWIAVPDEFVAVMNSVLPPPNPKNPPLDAELGVPAMVAVPLPLLVNVTPEGSDPKSDRVGVGEPVVVTEKEKAVPAFTVSDEALVKAGAWPTVKVKLCFAVPDALVAEKVIG